MATCNVCHRDCTHSGICALQTEWHPFAFGASMQNALRSGIKGGHANGRLERVLRKIRAGKHVVITALGASVTSDYAGAIGWMQRRFSLGYVGIPQKCHDIPSCLAPGWMLPVVDLLSRRFSPSAGAWPPLSINTSHKGLTFINAGVAARKMELFADCLTSRVPASTDLFVLDAASNPLQDSARAEHTLRRLLALPNSPAVVLIHFPRWCEPEGRMPMGSSYADEARRGACYTPDRLRAVAPGSNRTASGRTEIVLDGLAAHYGLPALSLRSALFASALNASTDAFFRPQALTVDGLHPRRGAAEQERYMQITAALLSQYLWDAWQRLDARPTSTHRRAVHSHACQLPAPLMRTPTAAQNEVVMEKCFGWDAADAAPVSPNGRAAPSLLPGSFGWSRVEFDSAHAADARTAACGPAPEAQGRRLPGMPDSSQSSAWSACVAAMRIKPKPGLAAFSAGSVARLQLGVDGAIGAASVQLALTYLSSYQGMGMARIRCDGGCACESARIDAHRGSEEQVAAVSIWRAMRMPLHLAALASSCVLVLDVLNETRSAGFKFKVSELTLVRMGGPRTAEGARTCLSAPDLTDAAAPPRRRLAAAKRKRRR